MTYQRKEARPGPILTVERARRLNSTMRVELDRLNTERAHLEPRLEEVRAEVTKARKLLTHKIRELEAARTQLSRLATIEITSNEPIYGGPQGLEAATQEIKEHEFKLDKLGRRRRIHGPSHGTRQKYDTGCRCDQCMDWRRKRSEQERINQKARRESNRQAA